MTTWQDLTQQEQAALVSTALSEDYLLNVSRLAAHRGTETPYLRLCVLGLLCEWGRAEGYITFIMMPNADALLLAAPDDPGANDFFPLASDMAAVKDKLRRQGFRLEE